MVISQEISEDADELKEKMKITEGLVELFDKVELSYQILGQEVKKR